MNQYKKSAGFRKIFNRVLPNKPGPARELLAADFIQDYMRYLYGQESMDQKLFYNIGAGNQRSRHSFWSYVDMTDSKYDKEGIDIFFDLESLKPIPVEADNAEVVFNSFVIEHISKAATENLCREAFRMLKPGGVFHSKVHEWDYSYSMFEKGVFSPMIPYYCRESRDVVNEFLRKHKGDVRSKFDKDGNYMVYKNGDENINVKFSLADSFIYHNAVAARENLPKDGKEAAAKLKSMHTNGPHEFYKKLREEYVDPALKHPHQHNADYYSKEDLRDFIKGLGFREVYFTQPYQSVCPALWDESLNPQHFGYTFAIEAIK